MASVWSWDENNRKWLSVDGRVSGGMRAANARVDRMYATARAEGITGAAFLALDGGKPITAPELAGLEIVGKTKRHDDEAREAFTEQAQTNGHALDEAAPARKPETVRLEITVEYDRAEWVRVYGDEFHKVPQMVADYFRAQVRESPAEQEGAVRSVTVREAKPDAKPVKGGHSHWRTENGETVPSDAMHCMAAVCNGKPVGARPGH